MNEKVKKPSQRNQSLSECIKKRDHGTVRYGMRRAEPSRAESSRLRERLHIGCSASASHHWWRSQSSINNAAHNRFLALVATPYTNRSCCSHLMSLVTRPTAAAAAAVGYGSSHSSVIQLRDMIQYIQYAFRLIGSCSSCCCCELLINRSSTSRKKWKKGRRRRRRRNQIKRIERSESSRVDSGKQRWI